MKTYIIKYLILGVQKPSSETQFDSRLFNQESGLDSGGIDDESYAVYSKAWRPQDNIQQSIYRPRQQAGMVKIAFTKLNYCIFRKSIWRRFG